MLERIAAFIEPTIDEEPPNPRSNRLADLWNLLKLGKRFRGLGSEMEEAIRVLTAPANHILDDWFESEQLKTTLPAPPRPTNHQRDSVQVGLDEGEER